MPFEARTDELLPPLDEGVRARSWRPPRVVLELLYDPVKEECSCRRQLW